jgi:hypothetical protein
VCVCARVSYACKYSVQRVKHGNYQRFPSDKTVFSYLFNTCRTFYTPPRIYCHKRIKQCILNSSSELHKLGSNLIRLVARFEVFTAINIRLLVCIALCYGLAVGVLGFDSRRGLGIFLFTTASRMAPGPTQPPIQRVPGALSVGDKAAGA